LMILPEHKERLISELLPRIKKAGVLTIHDRLAQKIEERPLKTEIYLDTEEGRIIAEIKFIYGDRVINPFAAVSAGNKRINKLNEPNELNELNELNNFIKSNESQSIIIRDGEQEKKVMRFFENSGFHILGTQVYLEDENDIFQFVETTLPALQQEGEVFFSESFRQVSRRPSPAFKGRVSINGESDLLELDFELEGINREELYGLFSALKEKKKYYRLKNGAFLPLASEELENMADFLDGLDLKKEDFARGHLELPKYRSLYLDSFMHQGRPGRFKRDKAFKELVQNVHEPEDTDFSLPPHLETVLRDYQKTGFKWLKTLAFYGFGGILADDMGLGKTLETISFMESEKEHDPRPALVIAPTSVIFNWQAEIKKFAPQLTTLVVSGTKGERAALIEHLDLQLHEQLNKHHDKHHDKHQVNQKEVDVVITSYPLIRNDISLYAGKSFSSCFLDEAQYIKNANSLTARSVKLISAGKYFALTGTPIENSLTELWSIFDFLMPGYLPSYNRFAQKYITPLKKEDGNHVLGELSRKVSPFVLRRMKKDVVRELPEKIELKMVSELTREQKKIYLVYLEQIKKDIAGEIQKNGFEKSRIKILAGLTRLRQICCHPALFLENFKGESGKLMQLEEVLADLKAGGHRCLLFSQFTSMLAIIRRMLDREDYRYFYLDGSVDSRDRVAMAEAFNRGEEDLFLISLKAGGTGLNLTGADTVIHFDPWWNPAVEDQATDRAHRIGQDKVVNVLKFISLGTIEEKIYELQQQKKNLINEVIKPGETLLSQLNEKEIKEILEMA
ncbi:MAG: SNF2 helicase associated domain-containing protein, partial [Dehalobacterium sp.]